MKHNHYSMYHKEKIIKFKYSKHGKLSVFDPYSIPMCLVYPNTFLGSIQLFFLFLFFSIPT